MPRSAGEGSCRADPMLSETGLHAVEVMGKMSKSHGNSFEGENGSILMGSPTDLAPVPMSRSLVFLQRCRSMSRHVYLGNQRKPNGRTVSSTGAALMLVRLQRITILSKDSAKSMQSLANILNLYQTALRHLQPIYNSVVGTFGILYRSLLSYDVIPP